MSGATGRPQGFMSFLEPGSLEAMPSPKPRPATPLRQSVTAPPPAPAVTKPRFPAISAPSLPETGSPQGLDIGASLSSQNSVTVNPLAQQNNAELTKSPSTPALNDPIQGLDPVTLSILGGLSPSTLGDPTKARG